VSVLIPRRRDAAQGDSLVLPSSVGNEAVELDLIHEVVEDVSSVGFESGVEKSLDDPVDLDEEKSAGELGVGETKTRFTRRSPSSRPRLIHGRGE